MKTKLIFQFICVLLLSLLVTPGAMCQQSNNTIPSNLPHEQVANGPGNGNYTYKLFVAPNKVYGYDIFRNGRIIFHQPALAKPAGNGASLTQKSQADKAAALAIGKIKKGMPPGLTMREIIQVTAN